MNQVETLLWLNRSLGKSHNPAREESRNVSNKDSRQSRNSGDLQFSRGTFNLLQDSFFRLLSSMDLRGETLRLDKVGVNLEADR